MRTIILLWHPTKYIRPHATAAEKTHLISNADIIHSRCVFLEYIYISGIYIYINIYVCISQDHLLYDCAMMELLTKRTTSGIIPSLPAANIYVTFSINVDLQELAVNTGIVIKLS